MLKDAIIGRLSSMKSPRTRTVAMVIAVFAIGFLVRGCFGQHEAVPTSNDTAGAVSSPAVWTCSMHPQIRSPKPGKCPICGMDLIPVKEGGGTQGPRTFVVTKESAALMNIQTVPVERKFVDAKIRMVGKVAYDETRLAYITAWVPGRLDKLYVDYTGIRVNEGDHMVYLYSPELISAQEELRQAKKTSESFADSSGAGKTALATLQASRERLRLWGLTPEQIATAEGGDFSDHITIYAPIGGTVIQRNGQEGMYVDTGMRIYTLADLDEMWVMFDAYESDLPWIRYGQHVVFTTEAYQGEQFEGMIVFIDPFLDPKTRTAKVRVNVSNTDGKLKPEMFVRGIVRSRIAEGGRVADPALVGKWMCPMHPEIVRGDPGNCPLCGMKLATATELGYVPEDELESAKPLVIPVTAALTTGTRAVVYVQLPDADKPTFEGRVIELGPRAGDYYIVHNGLSEGELVVVNGNFKIDSALQILAKPSMMLPGDGAIAGEHAAVGGDTNIGHEQLAAVPEFLEQLAGVYRAYLPLQESLAADDPGAAKVAAVTVTEALKAVDMKLLEGETHIVWMPMATAIDENLAAISTAADLDAMRSFFAALATQLTEALRTFGLKGGPPAYLIHCPMALDGKGADWLQKDTTINNPYLGVAMPGCGDVVEQIEPAAAPSPKADASTVLPFDSVAPAFQEQLAGIYRAYLPLQAALAADGLEAARAAVPPMDAALKTVDMKLLEGEGHMAWMPLAKAMEDGLDAMTKAADLEAIRRIFEPLATNLTQAIHQFGLKDGPPAYVLHCPMAFEGKGADWLQQDDTVRNPYFGAAMPGCGNVVEKIEPVVAP